MRKITRIGILTGTMASIVATPIAVVSCAGKNGDKPKQTTIELDTGSKLEFTRGAYEFYKTFVKQDTSLGYDLYKLHIVSGNIDESVVLSKDEVQQVRSAADIPERPTGRVTIDDWKDFAEPILNGETLYLLATKKHIYSKMRATKAEAIDKLTSQAFGGELPDGITITDIKKGSKPEDADEVKDISSFTGRGIDYQVIFSGKDESGKTKTVAIKTKINLDKKMETIQKHESKAGKIKQFIEKAKEKLHSFITKFKKFIEVTKEKIHNWGTIIVQFAQNAAEAIIDKVTDLIPPIRAFKVIPVVGAKAMKFVNEKIIDPFVSKIMTPIKNKLNDK